MMSIGPKIWIEHRSASVPLFGNIGMRMSVIELENKELMLISPVPLTTSLREDLKKLGRVQYLIGPNSMHHLSLEQYHSEYPQAFLAAPLKLQRKKKNLNFQITLGEKSDFPWTGEVETLLVDSPGLMSEAVFCHKPSRTLIVTDLLFNLQTADSKIHEWILRFNGSYQELAMSKLGRLLWSDRRLLKQKVELVSHWDFDQIVLAHGEIVVKNGRQSFLKSFEWLF